MQKLYLLHPIAVHFPIALLPLGLTLGLWSRLRGRPAWSAEAASWLLWLGAAAAWAALGLGLLAEDRAPHVPAAWHALHEHEELAWWTAGLFTFLSVWRWRLGRRWEEAFLAAWLAAICVLLATAYHGGELVYFFGVGVASP